MTSPVLTVAGTDVSEAIFSLSLSYSLDSLDVTLIDTEIAIGEEVKVYVPWPDFEVDPMDWDVDWTGSVSSWERSTVGLEASAAVLTHLVARNTEVLEDNGAADFDLDADNTSDAVEHVDARGSGD